MLTQTFTSASQRSQRITMLGPCTLSLSMSGSSTILVQTDVAGTWVTMDSGTLTASTSIAIEPGGVPFIISLLNSVHGANTTYALVGNFLADEETTVTGFISILDEAGDDILQEDNNYLFLEAA